jgi:hypothetical protein
LDYLNTSTPSTERAIIKALEEKTSLFTNSFRSSIFDLKDGTTNARAEHIDNNQIKRMLPKRKMICNLSISRLITVIFNYARSGYTVLSVCRGSTSNIGGEEYTRK